MFIDRYYDLIEKTHSYQENRKDFVYFSLNPDYKFRDKWNRRQFYVEAKFRSGIYQNKIIWCNEKQLFWYQQINKTVPVFLILGVGSDPSYPEALSLIPLSQAKYTGLFLSVVERFEIELDRVLHLTIYGIVNRNFIN